MPAESIPLPVRVHRSELDVLKAEAAKRGLALPAYVRRKLGLKPPANVGRPKRTPPKSIGVGTRSGATHE